MTNYALVNLDWSQGGDYRLLRQIAEDADVVIFVEGRRGNNAPVNVAQALPGFDVVQDMSSGERAGSGIAVRRGGHLKLRRSWMHLASRSGRQVQNRYRQASVVIDRTKKRGKRRVLVGAQHNAVASNERHDDGMRSAARWIAWADRWCALTGGRAVLAMDSNDTPTGTQNKTGAFRQFGVKPMVFLLSNGWGHVKFDAYDADGTDHKVLTMKEKS